MEGMQGNDLDTPTAVAGWILLEEWDIDSNMTSVILQNDEM